ncbi:Nitrate reductase cytochrome c-type subunit (NapB) [Stieleria maiorica]|uniref:Nitrate reductase cytochrome c-type subunit (NapB) n=1 Tax=Stieleria maiorica TaxID=2795974 RepID=A0A5B9MLQ8_9BACT|nr:diheme cytochrome c precursor [Stieleria maiorica]QEG01340.1 Nitrate reductase cytochrome c-type subunit (NapB) [Stieleria maiorica]
MSDQPAPARRGRLTSIFLFVVIVVSAIGYLVGLSDGVPKADGIPGGPIAAVAETSNTDTSGKVVAAVNYAEIPATAMGPTAAFQSKPASLPQPPEYDLFVKIEPSEADKAESSRIRSSRRAYNGAPPVIPHAVENTSDAACYACHGGGIQMAGMKASVMSHVYLANCTQCHAPPPPAPFQDVPHEVDNRFVGLAAPQAGKRAYPGAPPTIPHSQWMRESCSACHGGPNGWAGMESTHPWRTICTQCHAPSAVLDQAIPTETIPMLPPLDVAAK